MFARLLEEVVKDAQTLFSVDPCLTTSVFPGSQCKVYQIDAIKLQKTHQPARKITNNINPLLKILPKTIVQENEDPGLAVEIL